MTAALVFVGADGRQRPAPVSAAWWVGMLAAVPAGAVMVCRVLAAQGRLDLGACPAAAGATTAAWLMVAVAAASARSGDDFEHALIFCGLWALLAGVVVYIRRRRARQRHMLLPLLRPTCRRRRCCCC